MHIKYFFYFTGVLIAGFIGCTTHSLDTAWQESQVPAEKYETYQSSHQTLTDTSPLPALEEPSGIITLNHCLAQALLKNPGLRAFSWEVRAKDAQLIQTGVLHNPEPGMEMENFGGSGSFRGIEGNETTYRVTQFIELGGKRTKRTRVAALERDAAELDYESRRLEVITLTTKAFIDVLAAQKRLALAEELTYLADQVFMTVSERVRSGQSSPVEETKARVILIGNQIELDQSRRELEMVRIALATAWGNIKPVFEKADGQLEVLRTLPPVEHLLSRLSQNPKMNRGIVKTEQHRAMVNLENAKKIPDLTLSGGVRQISGVKDNTYVFGLSFPLPVLDRNRGGVLEARYRLAKAEEERRALKLEIYSLVLQTYQTLSSSFAQASALKNDVLPGAQRIFDVYKEGYRQGKFGYLELLEAQRTLVEVRKKYIEVLAVYLKTAADIELLIAEPLDNAVTPPENN